MKDNYENIQEKDEHWSAPLKGEGELFLNIYVLVKKIWGRGGKTLSFDKLGGVYPIVPSTS